MSDKMEQAILAQMDGKPNKQHCPKCNKETTYICHKSGMADCTECGVEGKIDLSELIKKLKAMGVFVK